MFKKQIKSPAELNCEMLIEMRENCANKLRGLVRRALGLEKMLSLLFEETPHRKTAETDFAETKAKIIECIDRYDNLTLEYNICAETCGKYPSTITGHEIVLYEIQSKLF